MIYFPLIVWNSGSKGLIPEQIRRKKINSLAKIKAPGASRGLGMTRAVKISELADKVPPCPMAEVEAQIISGYSKRIQELTKQIDTLDQKLETRVKKTSQGQSLLHFSGIGTKLAARILGETGNVDRFPTKDKYSAYCGVVCLDNSSGKRKGSKAAKQVNYILKDSFMHMALSSIRVNQKSADYYKRKRAEGLGHWAAIKRLAHQLCKLVYKSLQKA